VAIGSTVRDQRGVDEVIDLLRAQGHRITTPRRLLIQCLVAAGGHRTADELAAEVQAQAPDVNLSTIYRNLDELERLGVIEHAHLGHGAATYHLATERHGHLVCSDCDAVIEVPDALFRSLRREVASQHGFTIDPHHVAMHGRCAKCQLTNGESL
jgi:Fur family transcriptional regulator, ferric uptake regulator